MKIIPSIKLIFKTYVLSLSIFSLYRMILFLTELDRINLGAVSIFTILHAFVMGIRFDTVITGYILFIPAFILFIMDIINLHGRLARQILFYWVFFLFTFSFFISSADIPYFNQFFDRFSIGAFEWIENFDFVFSMIIQEPRYFLIIIPFILFEILFFRLLKSIFSEKHETPPINIGVKIGMSIIVLLMMFVGIRGRVQQKSPIRIGTAYFSDNAFLNKLGLNPLFTLMRSYINSKDKNNVTVHLMDNATAIAKIRNYLNITDSTFNSPIARKVTFDAPAAEKPNVILVIMESMSAAKMKRYGNKNNLTPFLDSLANHSLYFEHAYTAGKHTFNGVFGSLFSFPALYRQHPMKKMINYDGLSNTLLQYGYSTTYFTTHDSQFDNIGGFLRANGFQNIISQSDYPSSEIKTTLGVPDDYMFRFSIPVLNKLYETGKPFFAAFMTASDHGPYYIPDYFMPKTTEKKQQSVEYADWSLRKFIELSSKEAWYDNTIFIFIADHGAALNAKYDISLNYFHSPLIFFAPKILKDKIYRNIGSQIDIYPTLMGLLKFPYINNTLGVDLINEKREYDIVNDDDKIGILDSNYFCILKEDVAKLYKYRDNDMMDYSKQEADLVNKMTAYAKAYLQVYQYMILNRKTSIHSHN